ncbi:MAG: hypothetical protein WDN50_13280 [Bradyrhizobium sp.]
MRRTFLLLLGYFAGINMCCAAPAQLYNKTITITWLSETVQRDPDGTVHPGQTHIAYIIYVSSAGRLFERSSRGSGRRLGTSDNSPGTGSTRNGEARGLRFEGNRLVINRSYSGGGGAGAVRAEVDFDGSFSSCTVNVTVGKEGGVVKRKGLDGVVREMLSIKTTNTNCSIREGNAFADQ